MSDTEKRVSEITDILTAHTIGHIKLGALLALAEHNEDYKKYNHTKMTTWIADMWNMKAARYYQIRQVFELFGGYVIENKDLSTIDFSRLRALCPLVKDSTPDSDVLDYLHKAKTLTTRDFIAWVKTMQGKPDQAKCGHEVTEMHRKCKICGMKVDEK